MTYFSWPWIFYINLPLGLLSFAGIGIFFKEFREKPGRAELDWAGITCFSGAVLAGLTLIMTGGREVPWGSPVGLGLAAAALVLGIGFVLAERRAKDPFLDFSFFKYPGFALGNAVTLGASFSMFALFAYAPLFLQGALFQTPMVVGYAMLSLSLGWSLGSLILGRRVDRIGKKKASLAGCLFMVAGTCLCLGFNRETHLLYCFFVFLLIGLGMGSVTLSTLLIVQDSVEPKDLGVATSLHQFARTLGGTIGVGICGGVVTSRLFQGIEAGSAGLTGEMAEQLKESMSHLFSPEFRAGIVPQTLDLLQNAVLDGVWAAFAVTVGVSVLGLILALYLPSENP